MSATLQNTLNIHVDIDTLRKGESNITGVISLQVGDVYFPEQDWNDFPVIVLGWWLTELLRLWHGELKAAEGVQCLFMDGDFYYTVSARGERWLIECVDGRPDGEVVAEAEVDRTEFMKQIINSATQTLNACRAHRWHTADTKALAVMVKRGAREILSQAT